MPGLRRSSLAIFAVAAFLAACAGPSDPPDISVTATAIAPAFSPTVTKSNVKIPSKTAAVDPAPTKPPAVTPTATAAPPAALADRLDTDSTAVRSLDGLTEEQRVLLASHPPQGAAPELQNKQWLNSEPLQLADLRGKVVLLDMWTFG